MNAVENTPNPFNLPLTVSKPPETEKISLTCRQWHGVNMAEGLKALPATYRFTHNQSGTFQSPVYVFERGIMIVN